MKTLATILFAALCFTGCATDADESFDIGTPATRTPPLLDDGRVVWAEAIEGEAADLVALHHYDSETGIDVIEVLDENGLVLRVIETRVRPTEIPVDTTAL